jgi:hypothetical protein
MKTTMQKHHLTTAHTLYMLYETLPNETQEIFLQELLAKQADRIKNKAPYLTSPEAKEETNEQSHFQELFGILTASKGASLEDMKLAVFRRTKERFNDCD